MALRWYGAVYPPPIRTAEFFYNIEKKLYFSTKR